MGPSAAAEGRSTRSVARICRFWAGALPILTWSGLRGGISVALALSLPIGTHRSTLITMTYVVVCFSILVQGLTVQRVVKGVLARTTPNADLHHAAEASVNV